MIRILKEGEVSREEILARSTAAADVSAAVSKILENVRTRGDAALLEYTLLFDKAFLGSPEVTPEEWEEGVLSVDPDLGRVLKEAAANIRRFHSRQLRTGFLLSEGDGRLMGQKVTPLDRVGLYVPGGTAAYPSTVLMDAIPAKLAGVGELIMVSPPGPDGKLRPALLAAAREAGVDRIFKAGGAQAVAALAYGTESVPRVDKIVGPGNIFVAEAKKQVFGRVAIDMIAGPSEILVIADGASDPAHVAADLLSQAEHDRLATAVLITDSEDLALAVRDELERQLPQLPRAGIARTSIDTNGKIILTKDLKRAVALSNELAPEHLEIMTDDPFPLFDLVKHAGSVFLGRSCPEALGDYLAGPNHTLPTLGTARFSSPLSVDDFVKKTQFTYFTPEAFARVAPDIAVFASNEGLTAHAESALIRVREGS
ncbi:MAG: histidinol dehydrogenase [Lachnospiraceae bacterium]|nr:histidinol dehydrogenase [Lachnospiraceae bacterium]